MTNLKEKMAAELAELNFIGNEFNLIPLNGGAVNCSYRLESQATHYFVKTFESDQIAVLARSKLFEIQQQLAELGLAVKPIYLSKCGDFQIDEWSKTTTLDVADVTNLDSTKILAASLSQIHKANIVASILDLPQQWQHYAEYSGLPMSHAERLTMDRYADIWYHACAEETVFCHNDLALCHVTNSQPVKIFDWEYCAKSSRYFDVASCVLVNGMNATDEASLCALYAQNSELHTSTVIENVTLMKPLVKLTNRLWYQAARRVN